MRLPGRKQRAAPPPSPAPRAGGGGGGGGQLRQRLERAEKELKALHRKVGMLEREIDEGRQLNKQVAEMVDVIGEVLLPVEHRDEERLHALLKKYDATL